jgi:hypothetical protein
MFWDAASVSFERQIHDTFSPPPRSRADPERVDPRNWPSLIAWIGKATWREWLKITAFVILVIVAARFAGWR